MGHRLKKKKKKQKKKTRGEKMTEAIRAFVKGMREFRSDVTTHYDNYDLLITYDWGREIAHRLTFRHWDSSR